MGALDARALLGDGANLFVYLKSNPNNGSDPSGLFSLADVSMRQVVAMGTTAITVGCMVNDAFNYFKMFRDGVQLHQLLMTIAIDAAFDFTGGKLFGIALKGAGKIFGKGMSKGVAAAGVIRQQAAEWLTKGPKNVHVYIGKKGDKIACYVGISNDVARRQAQHGDRFILDQVTTEPLHRNQARALEQLIIDNNRKSFENIRNSISPEGEFFDDARIWALEYITKNGIQVNF